MGRRRRSGFDVGKLWRPGRGKAVTTGPREDFELTGFRAAGFLSAVADRFGLWGPPGAPNVAWGAWQPFVEYVAKLNWFAPKTLIPALAWASTLGEIVVAVGLLIGWQLRWVALACGLLLISFAVTMAIALGIKAPLDFSVFGAAAGAFLLAAIRSGVNKASNLKNAGR
jgi:putative oxidoreductase